MSFDLNDSAFLADPYPVYARLRTHEPVVYLPMRQLWVLSRHADVVGALRDPVTFSSDLTRLAKGMSVHPFDPAMRGPRLAALAARIPGLRVLLTSDPPEHTVLRRKVTRAFTPRVIAAWEPRIREITEELVGELGRADGSGRADLVAELASPLPTIVIAEMMDIPAERRQDFKRWSDDLVDGLLGRGSRLKTATSAIEISLFFASIVRKRRARPGDDLVSMLVTGDDESALNVIELVTFCVLLLVAGNETTTNLVANAMLALFDHPEVLRELQRDPSRAGAVVEETLRYDNPAQGLLRVTTTDVTIGSSVIPTGGKVLAMIGSANRDPDHWSDPDRFVPARQPDDHIGFGTGIHFCLGAPLARLEARVALETLFRRLSSVAPSGEPVRTTSPVLRGLRSLPVVIGRGADAAATRSR